ncbi:hypothetical protein QAD02_019593 [Eretmocerus hayati]|uniref:Uncharacterized protein n=1 Tax=Eretmocerus hayati TaxID=131215 RepID=A0ACC2PLV6_9HYME|nr:hypothetical protein QAD02_019593 [Eretmocerus hayati]
MLQAVRLLTEMARTTEDRSRNDVGPTSESQNPQTNTEVPAQLSFREIHKNGWLRRTDARSEKEPPRSWVVFCVHDDTNPCLEGFIDQKQATQHNPLWSQSLQNALHVSPTLCATPKNDYEFCINFNNDQILRLAAPTYQIMLDWVQVITRKLTDMKVLKPKENLYSRGPERTATRDPTSPLPPPPSLTTLNARVPANSISPSTSNAPAIFTFDDIFTEERRPSNRQPTRPAPPVPTSPRLVNNLASTTNTNDSSYDSVFLASSHQQTEEPARTTNPATIRSQGSSDEGEQYAALIEYRTSETNGESTTPATASQSRQARTQLTLREQQVLQLRKEMSHPAGVRLKLGRRDCKDSIAFVDCFGAVWVAGWKHKDHPLLYNVLHIGDLVLSVAGVPLNGAASVKDILKNVTFPRVEMVVRRLPHGKVTTLTRRSESEDFGLEVGSANEVISVSSSAQLLGLSSVANPADPSADVGTTVSWTLTEVNNRPLSLFEPGGARERLNAIGRDASVVMQPSDLVNSIKKKLRAVRSYKSFVLP